MVKPKLSREKNINNQNMSVKPAVAPSSTDVPPEVAQLLPILANYSKLQEYERRLDLFTQRKNIDLHAQLSQPQSSSKTLRFFIYNTSENQPWQVNSVGDPSWTLRIEGRLLDSDAKFSSCLSGISVSSNGAEFPLVEWHASPDVVFDGLDIKRLGSENVPVRITIQPLQTACKMVLSRELANLLGVSEGSHHEILWMLSQYIRLFKLAIDDEVVCDAGMEAVFGVAKFQWKELPMHVAKHLNPPKPITLEYVVRVDKASTLGDVVFDVVIDGTAIEAAIAQQQQQPGQPAATTEAQKHAANNHAILTRNDAQLAELQTKAATTAQQIQTSFARYKLFSQIAEDPSGTLEKWVESSSKSLKFLSGRDGLSEHEVRRSDFYTDVEEGVGILLGGVANKNPRI